MNSLRNEIESFLNFKPIEAVPAVFRHESIHTDNYTRTLISYPSSDGETGETIEAFLFEPDEPLAAAILVLHQHNSDWSLGKSEMAGLAGDPFQAFAPALARAGITVLAPDALGFESRCGVIPYDKDAAWLAYYNQMSHRLVRAELLMTKNLADVAAAISLLRIVTKSDRIGIAGHSHGGNIALFAAALDPTVAFTCASGAACSYRHKLAHGTGLEMSLVIPGFAARFDFEDLIRCIAPRSLFLVSSDDDPYSADAGELIKRTQDAFPPNHLQHLRTAGKHALDPERHRAIIYWLVSQAGATADSPGG